jgi:ABC-type multidrug transport system ATPase subunit
MLAAHQLRKNYGSLLAISDVSFNSLQARSSAIGPNGAGKSTTVKIIAGLIEPLPGSALQRSFTTPTWWVQRQIGYVPEEPNLYAYLSAREYLDMIGTLRDLRLCARKNGCTPRTVSALSAAARSAFFVFQRHAAESALVISASCTARSHHFR